MRLPARSALLVAATAALACSTPLVESTQTDAAAPVECSVDDRRCLDNVSQGCSDGRWVDDEVCASVCVDGQCEDADPACAVTTPCGTNEESCCASVTLVGSYMMGRSERGSDAFADGLFNEVPEHPAFVSPFAMDTFEITVGQFRAFVQGYAGPPEEGAGAHPLIPNSGWRSAWNGALPEDADALEAALECSELATYTTTPTAGDTLPINCVTWYELFAYCASLGRRLPTEAEWELAAAAGDENRRYPWGSDDPDLATASYLCGHDGEEGACSADDVAPVGSYAAGRSADGIADLGGNMMEWTLDVHAGDWYANGGATCDDCANLEPDSDNRVLRGGSFRSVSPGDLRAARRNSALPEHRSDAIGGRCVR